MNMLEPFRATTRTARNYCRSGGLLLAVAVVAGSLSGRAVAGDAHNRPPPAAAHLPTVASAGARPAEIHAVPSRAGACAEPAGRHAREHQAGQCQAGQHQAGQHQAGAGAAQPSRDPAGLPSYGGGTVEPRPVPASARREIMSLSIRLGSASAAAALLTGCSVGPDFLRPAAPDVKGYNRRTAGDLDRVGRCRRRRGAALRR